MTLPTQYDVTITIADVDVTCFISNTTMSMDLYPKQVSSFRFRVDNPVGIVPARNQTVIVIADSLPDTPVVFFGFIREIRTTKKGNGVNVFYECQASDSKLLLQRTVLDIESLEGSDSEILLALLANAYPDLSSQFDFSSNVDGFANGIDLPTGNTSILDSLNALSALTGADYSFNDVAGGSGDLITFDSSVDSFPVNFGAIVDPNPVAVISLQGGGLAQPALDATLGNPTFCARFNPPSGTFNSSKRFEVNAQTMQTSSTTLLNVTFDYYINSAINSDFTIEITIQGGGFYATTLGTLVADTWTGFDAVVDAGYTGADTVSSSLQFRIAFRTTTVFDVAVTPFDIRVDNLLVSTTNPQFPSDPGTELNWGNTPPDAPFDFDIDLSDEYGFDFDFSEGDYEDFNSITVVGGNSVEAIDWTYPNQDNQIHIDLETDVDDLAVYNNTGSEGSPIWTLLTVGIFGTDALGAVDVVYDKLHHWLKFETAPPNFDDAIRITGRILRPIRVRVENISSGDPIYATVIENKSITSTEQALALGNTKLTRRNAVQALTFKTYEPGLAPGQNINVTDTARGLDVTLVIQRIGVRWLGGDRAEFTVECGTDEIIGVDTIIAGNTRATRDTSLAAGALVVTYAAIEDRNNDILDDRYDRPVQGIKS